MSLPVVRFRLSDGWPTGVLAAISGFSSLVYEVVWERTLRYNFGGDAISSAIATGTFLLGLGLGAFIFGRWRHRALLIYGLVEIAIGAYGVVSFDYLASLSTQLAGVFDTPIASAEGLRGAVVVGSILFLLPPCILMGGTLPLMFNAFVPSGPYEARAVGRIYGLNTLGASIGILTVPFAFLNHISIPATLRIVASANLFFGLGLCLLGLLQKAESPPDSEEDSVGSAVMPLRLVVLSFASGFLALSFEMLMFRALFLTSPSSPYVFPLGLAPFLLALALGSLTFTRLRGATRQQALQRIGLLLILAQVAMVASVTLSSLFPYLHLPVRMDEWRHGYVFVYWVLLTTPFAFVMGGVFPLLLRAAADQGRQLPRSTGVLYFANAAGAFAGALAAPLVGVPLVGSKGVVAACFVIGVALGIYGILLSPNARRSAVIAGSVALAMVPLLVTRSVWSIFAVGVNSEPVDAVEGASGVATLEWTPDFATAHVKVNGQGMSDLPDHPKHVRLVSFALAMPHREQVLVLGLGGGGMVRRLDMESAVRRVDVVDWSRELPELLATPRARRLLNDALSSPKVRIIRTDARVAVSLYEPASFDIAIDNLTKTHWVGATSVRSTGYFQEVRRILKPTGVLVLDANYGGVQDHRALLSSLLSVFPCVLEHEPSLVLASASPIAFEMERARAVFEPTAAEMARRWPGSGWMVGGADQAIRDLLPVSATDLRGVAPIRDDLLTFEYYRHPLRVLQRMWDGRKRPPDDVGARGGDGPPVPSAARAASCLQLHDSANQQP